MSCFVEPTDGRDEEGSGAQRHGDHDRALQVLLVSCNPRWTAAVHAVAAEIRGSEVTSCDARDAVLQVAAGERFSHLLVETDCADGLLDALADLTSAHSATRTALLLLGASANLRPPPNIIRSATRRSVRRALAPNTSPLEAGQTGMHPAELHAALSGTMIEARYQPIVRLADRQPVALEALARLNHPALGTLLPDCFVPQLEGAGLARELTEIISARVFADLNGPGFVGCNLMVTVNFPLDVLLQPAALTRLDAQRAAAGIPASQVVVELTESQPVEDMVTLRHSLEHLRALGYGVSIDDVSPSVPRLAPLLEMPFTCLKLDKDIVQASEHDAEALAFLRTTIDAAHFRHMSVVAEGVSTGSLWDLMQSIGVDEAQGFLVARPLPTAAIMIWLEAWQGRSTVPANA